MARNWTNGSGLALSAANMNALEADVTTALGVPDAALAARVVAGTTKTALDATYASNTALAGKEPALPTGTSAQYFRGDKTLATLDKSAVGLSNVDNTRDSDKPVSTATQAALNTIQSGEAQIWAGWRNAVASMATAPVKWLAIGDSITEGTGTTSWTNTWLTDAATLIRANYSGISSNTPTQQMGWLPVAQTSTSQVSPWVPGTAVSTASNFGLRNTKSAAIVNSNTLTATVTGTSVDVWWTQGAATVAFTVWVNGVLKATLGTSSGTTTSGFKSNVVLGAAGTYTVQIKANASASASYINGVTVYNGNEASGLVTFNAGVHGHQTTLWAASVANTNWRQDYLTLSPHLVTVMLGSNDYSSTLGRSGFVTNLTTIVNNLRDQQNGWPTILLIAPYKENYTYTPTWEQYEYSMERVAADLGVAYLDLRTKMPDVGSAGDTQGYYADQIHLTATGNDKVANEVASLLLAKAV